MTPRRVAIVHEWLDRPAGSERVVEQFLRLWPEADLFVLVDLRRNDDEWPFRHPARTSFLQRLPLPLRKRFRALLPLLPAAMRGHDLGGYDLVLSSHHCVAKGVRVPAAARHVSYVHTPMRYAWDMQEDYLATLGWLRPLVGWAARGVLAELRRFDRATARDIDTLIGNSSYVAERIRRCWQRDARVIPPPVDTAYFTPGGARGEAFLAAGRCVGYKRMALVAEAFVGLPQFPLVMIGDGPELARCRAIAARAPNIQVLGWQPQAVLREHLQTARALVFPPEEDFGILPVEALACGTPVLAHRIGGQAETIGGRWPHLLMDGSSVDGIRAAVRAFAAADPPGAEECITHAALYAPERFRERFAAVVEEAWG